MKSLPPVICLMGPTASGKTPLAIELVQRFPCEIISVDSAMVYRGMDIGTAKPDAELLKIAPHRLIDLVDPSETYSAGQFRQDAMREMADITARGHIPLLVGGTMMYFRILQQGIADLPSADITMRAALQGRADQEGWASLHHWLSSVDEIVAKRINPNDSQRIQRALEVYLLTGKNMTSWQAEATTPLSGYQVYNLALLPSDRAKLHEKIALRFDLMLQQGFEAEVQQLMARGDLQPDLPSMRSVGYRQMWDYLAGVSAFPDMRDQAIAATRQLAKRQLTWLRSWPDLLALDADSTDIFHQATLLVDQFIDN